METESKDKDKPTFRIEAMVADQGPGECEKKDQDLVELRYSEY